MTIDSTHFFASYRQDSNSEGANRHEREASGRCYSDPRGGLAGAGDASGRGGGVLHVGLHTAFNKPHEVSGEGKYLERVVRTPHTGRGAGHCGGWDGDDDSLGRVYGEGRCEAEGGVFYYWADEDDEG